jgi:hypothetical protein
MRIDPSGKIRLPENVLADSGLRPGTNVEFVVEGNTIRVVPMSAVREACRALLAIRALRGRATEAVTTDAILAFTRDASATR